MSGVVEKKKKATFLAKSKFWEGAPKKKGYKYETAGVAASEAMRARALAVGGETPPKTGTSGATKDPHGDC